VNGRVGSIAILGLAILAVAVPARARAQSLTYSKGQNIAPAYEGWEVAPDGVRYFVFGYMNRNWEEEIDVPIGPDNGFNPGSADRGQPTHFLPRRNRFVFKVRVPDGFTVKDELVWTLTAHGRTEKAYATLRPDYILDDVVKASETGALGAGTSSPEVRANHAPTIRIEEVKSRGVKAGDPLTLASVVADDGIPKRRGAGAGAAVRATGPAGSDPRSDVTVTAAPAAGRNVAMIPPTRITVGKNVGLHVSWFVYRGAGRVIFDPPQVKAWEDTRVGSNSPWAPQWAPPAIPADGRQEVRVTFSEPGTYVLRCRADDGALFADDEVTIVVTAPAEPTRPR
jgi:hypothetical protein